MKTILNTVLALALVAIAGCESRDSSPRVPRYEGPGEVTREIRESASHAREELEEAGEEIEEELDDHE